MSKKPPLPEKTALVVDDSRSARYAMRKLLENAGYTVDTTESAQDAYVYLQRRHPQVIFLDHQMPGSDGLDVLRSLKEDPENAGIPVVLCSAQEGGNVRQLAQQAGAVAVLAKPPDADQLKALLQRLAGATRAEGESAARTRRPPSLGTPVFHQPTASTLRPQPSVTREDVNVGNRHALETTRAGDSAIRAEILELRRTIKQLQNELAELRQSQARDMRPERLLSVLMPALLQALGQPQAQRAAAQILQHGLARMLQETRALLAQTDDSNKA